MTGPSEELRKFESDGLLRSLRPLDSPAGPQIIRDGLTLWNFASNDYLGLSRHPAIAEALMEGVRHYGSGSAASRLVCGTLPPHQELEQTLAAAKQCDAALTFSSGFATPLGLIPAILGKADFILLDKLCHACLVDAARLSGATLRVFPHNDLTKLAKLLSGIRSKSPQSRVLIATESVFSMDGDTCPLREILDLAEAHEALTLVDEAHGFGVLGKTGMGLAEHHQVQHRITFQMGTLSKSAGLAGGYVAASRDWIDLLVNRARSFIYSTAPPPALAHAAITALRLIQSAEGHRLRAGLQNHITRMAGPPTDGTPRSPILPIICGTNEAVLQTAADLCDQGFLVPAIRFPTVPRGSARLRVSLSAAHPTQAVEALCEAFTRLKTSL